MFSEVLCIMDRNTEKYMVDELKERVEFVTQRAEAAEQRADNEKQRAENKDREIEEYHFLACDGSDLNTPAYDTAIDIFQQRLQIMAMR